MILLREDLRTMDDSALKKACKERKINPSGGTAAMVGMLALWIELKEMECAVMGLNPGFSSELDGV
jgi:hypothetical protein